MVKKRQESLTLKPETRDYFLERRDAVPPQVLFSNDDGRALWRANADELVAEFAAQCPGQRPAAWWEWTAPEPRKRLGGVGIEAHKRLAYSAHCTYGITSVFIGCDDPANLPFFESEAAYLRRHNSFLPGENTRVPPEMFEPEEIDDSRILRLRPLAELNAEYAARKAAGTLGKHDPRFDR